MKKSYGNFVAMGLALAVVAFAGNAEARVTGVCSDCHTMHNSQDGAAMPITGTNTTAKGALVRNDCVGCHSDAAGVLVRGATPIVYRTGAPSSTPKYLAGGDFYWAKTDQTKGHNPVSIPGMSSDSTLTVPPGWVAGRNPTGGTAPAAGGAWTAANKLTCAGTYGCHGNHAANLDDFGGVSGSHHAGGAIDGATTGTSYRFLLGITGEEDADWEKTTAAGDHNFYKGKARNDDDTGQSGANTISYLCGECHGNFHAGADLIAASDAWNTAGTAAPWLRHPTDFDLNKATQRAGGDDYDGYTYDVTVPVGTTDPTTAKAAGNDSLLAANVAGQAIVTCISCHKAHGSEYADLLRWDYTAMNAGGGSNTTGCFVCHTTKDGV